ncbi:winged helix-turn-helix domain-containing protein [Streptomyces sp. NPDC002677]|uniref:winged helix-turn-helix domain-containing protein n=1 Tax=Streptomyces sp. NPDC002677 TaxID=3154774 RepID=UPI00333020D9
MRVIDGMHRLRVARRRGRQSIEARFFEGSPQDAFVLAVEANVTGGLPLAQAERVTAAARIVRTHPHWSDRAIASVTGLSAKTVGAQRRRLGGSAVPEEVRVGRDGRTRPLSSARGRRIASRLLAETPNASLREIAKKAGISPGTVRDVRRRLERGENPVPPRQRSAQPRQTSRPGVTTHAQATARGAAMADLRTQPAPALSEMETLLLCMMEIHTTDAEQWDRMADSVPAHYARAVSVMAAACADAWHNLAVALRGSPPGGRGGQGGAAHRGPVTTAPTV